MHIFALPTFLLALGTLVSSSPHGARMHERGLPITSTTTITVEATVTQTVWQSHPTAALALSAMASQSSPISALFHSSSHPSVISSAVPTMSVSATSHRSSSSLASTRTLASSSRPAAAASSASSVVSLSAAAAPTSVSTSSSSSPILAAYYPDWISEQISPEQINWKKFDWVTFAFAILDSNLNLVFTQDNSEDLLKRTVSTAHAAGKHVKLSVGGWTGSAYFSTAVANDSNRKNLASKMLALYNKFSLDGIDIDWEYPGTGGQDGNIVSGADSANYLIFLQLLKTTLPAKAKISAAVQVWPFAGPDGNPMSDVSAFAKVLDWITIMNYDVWGSSSTPGPNAPLSNGCGNSLQPLANAYASVNSWTSAGFPANQIALGAAAYGYISKSGATALVDRRRRASSPARRANVVLVNEDGGSSDGQIMFNDLVQQGALTLDPATKKFLGTGGFTRLWDTCSSTPFLRSAASGQVITYDDPDSLSLKAQFALQSGLKGINVWDMHGDTSSWVLMDALRAGLGLA